MRLSEIRIAGFGGQGVILCASIIGKAASIHEAGYATMTQNFGAPRRRAAGACSAQVILSDQPVLYPYVTYPDVFGRHVAGGLHEVLTGAETGWSAAGRTGPSRDVGAEEAPPGFSASRPRALAEELGKKMVLNVVMVGCFGAVTGLLFAANRCVRRGSRLGPGGISGAQSEGLRQGIRLRHNVPRPARESRGSGYGPRGRLRTILRSFGASSPVTQDVRPGI